MTAFNKFRPKKVEVNEATVEEAIKYGQFLKRSKEDITEAIDIYIRHWATKRLQSRRRSSGPARTTRTMTTSQVCSRKIFFLHNNICTQAIGLFYHCLRKKRLALPSLLHLITNTIIMHYMTLAPVPA